MRPIFKNDYRKKLVEKGITRKQLEQDQKVEW